MFSFLFDKLAGVIGNEAERQNAIARFGTGVSIDIALDGTVADPKDPSKRMRFDDFQKLPLKERFQAMVPTAERAQAERAMAEPIRPEDITLTSAIGLIKSSFNSDDAIGLEMRKSSADRVGSLVNGSMMSMLKGDELPDRPKNGPKMG